MKSFFVFCLAMLLVFFVGLNSSAVFAGDEKDEKKEEAKPTIKVKEKDEDTYWKLAKISLADAIKAALKEVKGTAIEATMEIDDDNYLVYYVYIVDKEGNGWFVTVDAGNGKVLEKVSEEEEDDDDDEEED